MLPNRTRALPYNPPQLREHVTIDHRPLKVTFSRVREFGFIELKRPPHLSDYLL